MDLASLGAFATNIVPGFQQGQEREATVELKQEAAKQAKLQTEDLSADIASNISYANSLAALGNALSPQQPQPPPPGQQSQATPQPPPVMATSTGAPIMPPGGQVGQPVPPQAQAPQPQAAPPSNGPPPPQAQPAPQGAPQQPRPQPPPQAQGQPPVGLPRAPGPQQPGLPGGQQPQQPGAQQGPPPTPQQLAQKSQAAAQMVEQKTAPATQGAQGQMSAQQLVALVNKANPGLAQKNPAAFVKTVEKLQRFLSADGKQELQAQKISMEYDAKIKDIQQKGDIAAQRAQSAVDVATIRAETATQVAQIAQERALLLQQQKDAGADKRLDKTLEDKDKNLDKTIASKEKIAAATAQAKKDVAGGKMPDTDTLKALGAARKSGDSSVISNLGMGATEAKIAVTKEALDQLRAEGSTNPGRDLAAIDEKYKATQQGLNTVSRRGAQLSQAGGAALSAGDLVVQKSANVPRGAFTLGNDGLIAVKKGFSDPATAAYLASLNSFINLYARAISPTGQGRLGDKEHARDVLMKGYGQGAIEASMDVLKQELQFESGSTKATEKALGDSIGGTGEGTDLPANKGEGDRVDTSNPLLK